MPSFIRAAEWWQPSSDGSMLDFGSGLFAQANQFGAVTRGMCFGRGEGLPGRAWDEARPILLPQLGSSVFRRSTAAQAAGLAAAVAIPFFPAERFAGVLVLFLGDGSAHAGALELWHNDPRITGDLRLVEGFYGRDGQAFEALSRDSFLPRGSGLPGLAWQRRAAVFIDELATSPRFLRAADAAQAGISRGLALPCFAPGAGTYVLSLLSALATPIAQGIESWRPDSSAGALERIFGHDESRGPLPGARLAFGGEHAILAAFDAGVPVLSTVAAQATVAMPVIDEGVVTEVVVLSF